MNEWGIKSLHFKKGEETERNSGFTEENLLPTRLCSQSKLPQ